MKKLDISTVEKRRALISKSLHESYLEGHVVTPYALSLCEEFIQGDIGIREMKQKYLSSILKDDK